MNMAPQRILLCGHRSFAARGLPELLTAAGHTVVTFSRGPVARDGNSVTGPVYALHENPHLTDPFDTVINYILLKDDDIERNDRYLDSLLKFCAARSVKHLVHISSMSVYKGEVRVVSENAEVETIPQRKGSYGSLKVAQDLFLNRNAPAELRLTMARPGFILAPGLMDPMIGMGVRFRNNKVLLIGAAHNHLPVVTRDQVNEAVARIVDLPADSKRDVFLIADPDSPTRGQWLKGCCELLGCGISVVSFPTFLWLMAGWFGEPVARIIKLGVSPAKIMSNVCRAQSYDTRRSAERLSMSMSVDWRKALVGSFAGQEHNFELPYERIEKRPLTANHIAIVGFGRIVKQKHLPALQRLGYNGQISAYDVVERVDGPHTIRRIDDATSLQGADLVVLASPGANHTQAISLLRTSEAPILVEKPLCMSPDELSQWIEFAGSRSAPVRVCHNYRFKENVAAMLAHLARYNPGKLLRADVCFHSPSVAKESRPWARNERRAQTLLMDYAVHFIDIACMFNREQWKLDACRSEMDHLGNTGMIEGRLTCAAYPVNFVLRQGLMPRRARLLFTFQNYSISLGFFPDTFVAHMADDNAALYAAEKRASGRATRRKILDKLLRRDSDLSHDAAYLASAADPRLGESITVQNVAAFYRAAFDLADAVYGRQPEGA